MTVRATVLARALVVTATLGVPACSRSGAGTQDAGVSSSDASQPSARDAATPVPTTAHTRPALAPCRVIAVSGKGVVSQPGDAGAHAIALGDAVDAWIDLEPAARVTVKEPRTGRELLFEGGARALPCAEETESWLARGAFYGSRGSGEKPGAEQWVVTPSAVVRYGAATVDVTVAADGTHVALKGGSAVALADGDDTWLALDVKAPPFVAKPPADADAAPAADHCAKVTDAAKALEDQLLAPGETRDPGFGDLAKRATEARILARAVCAMSALRTLPTTLR